LAGGHWSLGVATGSIVRAGREIIRKNLWASFKAGSAAGPAHSPSYRDEWATCPDRWLAGRQARRKMMQHSKYNVRTRGPQSTLRPSARRWRTAKDFSAKNVLDKAFFLIEGHLPYL